ncbi:basic proline-rich protein-like [Macrobrachium nipponense]|uniref:basic proline-rich protein-like n=1 Tax=Macrobrachium nipponense TaxID=159736 RepID=UPI0030C8202C
MGSRLRPPPVEPFLLLRLGGQPPTGPPPVGSSPPARWDGQPPAPAGRALPPASAGMGSRLRPPPGRASPFPPASAGMSAASGPPPVRGPSYLPSGLGNWAPAGLRPPPVSPSSLLRLGMGSRLPAPRSPEPSFLASAGMGSRALPGPRRSSPFLLLSAGNGQPPRPRRRSPRPFLLAFGWDGLAAFRPPPVEPFPPCFSAGMEGSRLRPPPVEPFLLPGFRGSGAAASGPRPLRLRPSSLFGWMAAASGPAGSGGPSSCFGWGLWAAGLPGPPPVPRDLLLASGRSPFLCLALGWDGQAASVPAVGSPPCLPGLGLGSPPASLPFPAFAWDGQPPPDPGGAPGLGQWGSRLPAHCQSSPSLLAFKPGMGAVPPASGPTWFTERSGRTLQAWTEWLALPVKAGDWTLPARTEWLALPAEAGGQTLPDASRAFSPSSAGMGSRLRALPVEPFLLLWLGWAATSGHRQSSHSSCYGWDGQPPLALAARALPPVSAGIGSCLRPLPVEPFLLLWLGWAAASDPRRSSPSSCFGWDGQPPPDPAGRALPAASAGMGNRLRTPPVEPFLLLRLGWAAASGPRRLSPSCCFGWDGQPPPAIAGGALPPASARMGSRLRPPPVTERGGRTLLAWIEWLALPAKAGRRSL